MTLVRLPELASARLRRPEIDRRNPLTAGLIFCAYEGVDLISGVMAAPVSARSQTASTFEVGEYGLGLASRANNNGGWRFNNVYAAHHLQGRSAATLSVVGRMDIMQSFGVVLGIPHDDTTWTSPFVQIAFTRNSTNYAGRGAAAPNGSTTTGLSTGNTSFFNADALPHVYGMRFETGQPFFLFRDQAVLSGGAIPPGVLGGNSRSVYMMSRNAAATGEGSRGAIWLGAMWDRPLSAAEWANYAANPFQLLKPANPRTYFLPSAAVGPAFYLGTTPVAAAYLGTTPATLIR